ncbi:kinase domain protein [Dictyocaulus viviparus]|uniref:non-specific serine/threonine protein kinase n=1 Tax=Dictyocaulus viviparus TaxID=29172 RepID=A0A0D8XHL7_DICVI|nr:kinase domain protein [Dictyocaulus viviparus]
MLLETLPVRTASTGTFARVELAKHRITGHHFALKILNIHEVIKTRQIEHVHNEKNILTQLEHPFIVKLISTDKDDANLYMIMEFIPGGELFSYLRASRVFSNSVSRFYAAEIVCALEYIHGKNIVYRDLKPENLMLCRDGHIKMADFGFAKELKDRWALGILVYEMLIGRPPFRGSCTSEIYDSIMEYNLMFPQNFNSSAMDLIRKLLTIDSASRLGCSNNGVLDIFGHSWFRKIDWEDIRQLKIGPPIIPKLSHAGDTGNFYTCDEKDETELIAETEELELFDEW